MHMQSRTQVIGFALAAFAPRVLAKVWEPFSFCQEEFCDEAECPFYGSFSQEYPECAIYSAEDMQDYGFEGNGKGVFDLFLDIPDLDDSCHWILRSPASTDVQGCGYVAGTWANGGCDAVQLEKTFMIQWCCGTEDCSKAGISYPGSGSDVGKRSALAGNNVGGGAVLSKRSGGGAVTLTHKNGTVIEPIERGLPPEKRGILQPIEVGQPPELQDNQNRDVSKRDDDFKAPEANGNCEKGSWEADGEPYTKPSAETQLVATGGSSGQEIAITVERTTGIETTIGMEMSLGIEDILGIGLSFETSMKEEHTEGKQRTFKVPEGQQGDVGFTPYLICETGKGNCKGEDFDGEICSPYKDSSGELAGIYHIIQRGSSK